MTIPVLDTAQFDRLTRGSQKLWGLDSIAAAIGLGKDATRRLASVHGVPIYRPVGSSQYFALRDELAVWLRTSTVKCAEPDEIEEAITPKRYRGGGVNRYGGQRSVQSSSEHKGGQSAGTKSK
ncbi:hypothetical protein [Pontivivens nitratireducens]|uniref:hypothetical protein n=1 Tax=Pontivivens nitratireducens TaxID=2758038 RepID=UPI00163B6183|nr:hypothetical protein [Pontibrevibacter nitratireducens]